jgi:hypothetical protein
MGAAGAVMGMMLSGGGGGGGGGGGSDPSDPKYAWVYYPNGKRTYRKRQGAGCTYP